MEQNKKKKNSKGKENNEESKTIPEPIPRCRLCEILCFSPFNRLDCGDLLCTICFKINAVDPMWESLKSSSSESPEKKVDIQMQVKCQFNRCNYYAKRDALVGHEKTCQYYEAICAHGGCEWKGDPKELFDHFKSYHPFDLKVDHENRRVICIPLTNGTHIFYLHFEMVHGRVFFVEFILDPVHDTVVYTATNYNFFNAEKYKVMVHFITKGQKNEPRILNCFQTDNFVKKQGFHCRLTDLKPEQFILGYDIRIVKK